MTAMDVESIYEVPPGPRARGPRTRSSSLLDLPYRDKHMDDWVEMVQRAGPSDGEVVVGIVGKYVAYEVPTRA
jgi:CTP synthase (UTP-ammonia lyase)